MWTQDCENDLKSLFSLWECHLIHITPSFHFLLALTSGSHISSTCHYGLEYFRHLILRKYITFVIPMYTFLAVLFIKVYFLHLWIISVSATKKKKNEGTVKLSWNRGQDMVVYESLRAFYIIKTQCGCFSHLEKLAMVLNMLTTTTLANFFLH